MAYWLAKSEPSVYGIEDLRRDRKALWEGVRNYQARNYLKEMKRGDLVLFYHSSEDPIGVAGVAEVSREAAPDLTQFDRRSDYYDPKATQAAPRWFAPEIKFGAIWNPIVPLDRLRAEKGLSRMALLQRGSRLSVQPITPEEFAIIERIAMKEG